MSAFGVVSRSPTCGPQQHHSQGIGRSSSTAGVTGPVEAKSLGLSQVWAAASRPRSLSSITDRSDFPTLIHATHRPGIQQARSRLTCRCGAYISQGVKNVPVDVSAHARYV